MNMSRKAISVLKVNDYSCAKCTKESEQSNTQSNYVMHNLTDLPLALQLLQDEPYEPMHKAKHCRYYKKDSLPYRDSFRA